MEKLQFCSKCIELKASNHNHGMSTAVWGPPAWLFLHCIVLGYPCFIETEDDKQRQKDITGIGLQAAQSGNLGGGREGVLRSEYQTQSGLDRAALEAQLRQQNFQQAQQGAQTAFGQMQQLGADQQRMAQLMPQLRGQDISSLGQAGASQQAYQQAVLDQQREANRMAAYEPYERLGYMGTGLGGLFGSAMGQYQSTVTPNQSPLHQALGIASMGLGAYKALNNPGG